MTLRILGLGSVALFVALGCSGSEPTDADGAGGTSSSAGGGSATGGSGTPGNSVGGASGNGAANGGSGNASGGAGGAGPGGTNAGGTNAGGGGTAGGGRAAQTGGGGSGGSPPSDLLTDSRVPGCTISSQVADLRIQGTIAGQPVDMQQIPGSYIKKGELQLPGSYLTDAGYQLRDGLAMHWTGSLSPGTVTKLDGGTLYVSEDQPGGNKTYCFSDGEIAPVDSGVAGDPGRLFKFRLRAFAANADCSGGPVEGSVTGCIHRLRPELE